MNKKLRRLLWQIVFAAAAFVLSFAPVPFLLKLLLLAGAYLTVGMPVISRAWRNIVRGQVFDENFLMTIATFGAVILGEYAEAVAVMLFFQIGEFFQSYAVNRSRKSIAALMDIRPDYALLKRKDGVISVSPEEVAAGEIIEVRPGGKIPLDGIIVKGSSMLDTAALTGGILPREVRKGDEVISGSINLNSVLEIKTTREFGESTVAKILNLVENAASQKADIENFITRFARWYTPFVVIIALFLAFVPPLLFSSQTLHDWGYRALTFLVISCPCALVISIPLSFFGGIGAASKCGILIKGSNYLQALAQAETVVFDKTGTLTKGQFAVTKIIPQGVSGDKLLEVAAHIEAYSGHPIALSVQKAYGKKPDLKRLAGVRENFGLGITAELDGVAVAAGNRKMLQKYGIDLPDTKEEGTVIYVIMDRRFIGSILIEDEIKEDAAAAIAALKQQNIKQTVMLTGDRRAVAEKVAAGLGIDKVAAELLPAAKVEEVEKLLQNKTASGRLLFVGDGINDAPVLARSDVGIAMGGIGSDAAIEAADVVIMTDEPSKIATAIRIAQKTLLIAKENIVFAIGVKLLVLALGAAGYVSIWAAVFADVGVSVIAILNAVRALTFYKKCPPL